MKKSSVKLNKSAVLNAVKAVLSSRFFPFLTAAVVISCYYLGWDLVTFYYMAIVGITMVLLLDDISPLFGLFLFMNVMISRKNSPSATVNASHYYSETENVAQIIVLISLFVIAVIYRIVLTGVKRKFKPTPIFYGLCVLAAAFIMNGVAAAGYDLKNIAYGVFMAFFFLVVFTLMKDNVSPSKQTFERIAWAFIALSVLLLIELTVAYAKYGIVQDGHFDRNKLMFGWGIYNTMGMLIIMCIPSATYLAGKYKYGFPFTVYSFVLFVAAFFTLSRQAMLGAVIISPVSTVILLVKGKNMIPNLLITAACLIAGIVVLGLKQDVLLDYIIKTFKALFVNGELHGNGRMEIYRAAVRNFKSAPVFGTGFFVEIPNAANFVGLSIIPARYHNTLLQMLGACGGFGIIAYCVHRLQTVICYFKNVTVERTLIALTVFSLLLVSLFDNHMFNLLPTIVYSCLIAVLVKSQPKEKTETQSGGQAQ
ncbi:MAG: O-antigen ligase family protein [Clostridia bacterium]|nr:O-antigen ligase family protein [Clostridia bacterium]